MPNTYGTRLYTGRKEYMIYHKKNDDRIKMQWRRKGGGNGGGLPRAAAKLRLCLKIWIGKTCFEREKNFRKGLQKSLR